MSSRPQALTRLRAYLGVPGAPVRLSVRGRSAESVLRDFAEAAAWLQLEWDEAPSAHAQLELRGSHAHGSIRFLGELEGRLLESLAETLRSLATGEIAWDTPATPALLARLPERLALQVFVGPSCPFCPGVSAAALRMACGSPALDVDILRADQCPALGVTSVPCVRVGSTTLSRGAIPEYELAERLLDACS
ncbi:MAG: hypothetical protein GXP55_17665 [Deltaproteobacteria bacterium]|nr:hypothetical protein [Deltaproteobacteria bacterium]